LLYQRSKHQASKLVSDYERDQSSSEDMADAVMMGETLAAEAAA